MLFIVIVLFSIIHLIEVTAFFARSSGVSSGSTALGYALQNSVFMLTRVFTTALFPLLGFVVDSKVEQSSYLLMMSFSLLLASFCGFFVVFFRERVVLAFALIIERYNEKGRLLYQLLCFPFFLFRRNVCRGSSESNVFLNSFFWGGGFVFGVYSISVFISFYFGLVFYEYRATISQLSGVANAIATVVLTFYIEPKISSIIDNERDKASSSIASLMAGRVFGTFALGVVFLISVIALGMY